MIITISGYPGAGKTSVGKLLAKKLGYKFYSMGDLRGEIAVKKGLTINELNKLGEKEAWTDTSVDDYQKELGKTRNNLVIEGRLSFHFIPNSLKIFLTVNPRTGAERIFNVKEERLDEEIHSSVQELQTQLKARVESDTLRYKKYYNINCYEKDHYNLIVDTTVPTAEEVTNRILSQIQQVSIK
jgi:CMP/dCMP kinase